MGHIAGNPFGIGMPGSVPQGISGLWSYPGQTFGSSQGFATNPGQAFGLNPGQISSLNPGQPIGGVGMGPWQLLPPPLLHLLQIVPQQLQQLQLVQQQQAQQLQQLLQFIPAQLQQLQQLIQVLPFQLQQQLHQQQPYAPGISGPIGFGMTPPSFGGQGPGYVM